MARPFTVGFLVFPRLTQLDFTGPLQVLARLPNSETHIIAKSVAPIQSDCGLKLLPTCSFADAPMLDLICIPGGRGVAEAMADDETVEFVREKARAAQYVTSVCTGAFMLGVAGLLKGKRATTHWAFVDLLPLVGATHEIGKAFDHLGGKRPTRCASGGSQKQNGLKTAA